MKRGGKRSWKVDKAFSNEENGSIFKVKPDSQKKQQKKTTTQSYNFITFPIKKETLFYCKVKKEN